MRKNAKEMSKRSITLLIAVLMLFSLSACGTFLPADEFEDQREDQMDYAQNADDSMIESTDGMVEDSIPEDTMEDSTVGTEGLVFESNYDGTACFVSGYTGEETNVVIPTVYKGFPVTAIGENAFSNTDVVSVYIPNTVTVIGEHAFSGTKITEMVIPNSVVSIGERAFQFCGSLITIYIPTSVTSIGRNAFGMCVSLKEITIPISVKSVGDECFFKCENLTDIYCEAPMQPSSWSKYWKEDMPSTVTVHWDWVE